MKNENALDLEKYTDVRYNKVYSIFVIILAILFIILAIFFSMPSIVFVIVFLIIGLLLLFAGITLRGRKYLRLDKQNQIVMIFGIIGSFARKYPYDRIYLEGKKLYIEKSGKKKILNIMQYACDKRDFNTFIKEITS